MKLVFLDAKSWSVLNTDYTDYNRNVLISTFTFKTADTIDIRKKLSDNQTAYVIDYFHIIAILVSHRCPNPVLRGLLSITVFCPTRLTTAFYLG